MIIKIAATEWRATIFVYWMLCWDCDPEMSYLCTECFVGIVTRKCRICVLNAFLGLWPGNVIFVYWMLFWDCDPEMSYLCTECIFGIVTRKCRICVLNGLLGLWPGNVVFVYWMLFWDCDPEMSYLCTECFVGIVTWKCHNFSWNCCLRQGCLFLAEDLDKCHSEVSHCTWRCGVPGGMWNVRQRERERESSRVEEREEQGSS
jgi:DNA-directed RNA polymerase subunit RPC12/RpoP